MAAAARVADPELGHPLRQAAVAQDAQEEPSWACPRCTLDNAASSIACEACHAVRRERPVRGVGAADPQSSPRAGFCGGCLVRAKVLLTVLFCWAVGAVLASLLASLLFVDDGGHKESSNNAVVLSFLIGGLVGMLYAVCYVLPTMNRTSCFPDPRDLDDSTLRPDASRPWLAAERREDWDDTRDAGQHPDAALVRDYQRRRRHGLSRETERSQIQRNLQRSHEIRQLLRQSILAQARLQQEAGGQPVDEEVAPASVGAIYALPTHTVTQEQVAALQPECRQCAICIEDFRAGQEQRTLPCFHRFHVGCVDQWLQQNGSCPICKHRIDANSAGDAPESGEPSRPNAL